MGRPVITTTLSSSRYDTYVEDVNGVNVQDINGIDVTSVSGGLANAIDTQWENSRVLGDGLWTEDISPWEEDFFPWLYGNVISTTLTPRTKPTTIIN